MDLECKVNCAKVRTKRIALEFTPTHRLLNVALTPPVRSAAPTLFCWNDRVLQAPLELWSYGRLLGGVVNGGGE